MLLYERSRTSKFGNFEKTFLLMLEMALLLRWSSRSKLLLVNAKSDGLMHCSSINLIQHCTFGCQFGDFVVGEVDVPQVDGVDQHTTRQFGDAIVGHVKVLQVFPAGNDLLFDV